MKSAFCNDEKVDLLAVLYFRQNITLIHSLS